MLRMTLSELCLHRFDVPNCEIWYIRFCLDQKMQVSMMLMFYTTRVNQAAVVGGKGGMQSFA